MMMYSGHGDSSIIIFMIIIGIIFLVMLYSIMEYELDNIEESKKANFNDNIDYRAKCRWMETFLEENGDSNLAKITMPDKFKER